MGIFEWNDAFLSAGVVFANEQCLGLMLDIGHLVNPILPNVETMPMVLSNRRKYDQLHWMDTVRSFRDTYNYFLQDVP